MPNPEAYLLTDADRRVLERLLYEHNRFRKNPDQRPLANQEEHEEMSSPEVYAAKTPTGGIPPLTVFASTGEGDQPGSAECTILRLLPDVTNPDEMELVGVFTKEVYNLSTEAVEGEAWVLIARDKYGTWFVSGTPPTGQSCFPAEIIGQYEDQTGYTVKRMNIQDDGSFTDHPSEFTTYFVYSPDEDETLEVGTRGWLCPSPDDALDTGTHYGSDNEQRWIFISVYKTRTTCSGGNLIFQTSLDGGVTWLDAEDLNVSCGTATVGTGTVVDQAGTGTTPANTAGGGPCDIVKTKTTDCLIASGPYNIVYLTWGSTSFNSGLGDDLIYIDQQSGPVAFWFADGQPHLSVDGLELMHCGDLCFTGGPLTGHLPAGTDTSLACDGEVFTVCVECVECPTYYYCVATNGESCNGTGTATIPTEVMLLTIAEAAELGDNVCAGPFDTEAEATAACEKCPSCPGIPDTLYAHFTGAFTATIELTYDPDAPAWYNTEYVESSARAGPYCGTNIILEMVCPGGGVASIRIYGENGSNPFDTVDTTLVAITSCQPFAWTSSATLTNGTCDGQVLNVTVNETP